LKFKLLVEKSIVLNIQEL